MNLPFDNDHNVYILGAGFSVESGLPTISNFLLRMRDSHPWLVEQGRPAEADAVERVLRFRLEAASAAYWVTLDLENIEELFSLASASAGSLSDDIPIAIAATIDYAEKTGAKPARAIRIERVPIAGQVPWLPRAGDAIDSAFLLRDYPYYVAKLLGMFVDGEPKGKNTFITFNYDTVLEHALRDLSVQFCYGFTQKAVDWDESARTEVDDSALQVLKLHGSVNWGRQKGKRGRGLKVFRGYDELRQAAFVPELIPPTWKKIFESQLEAIWDAAVGALQTATRIIIIGFSMPATDLHFKYLMAAGLQENVSLRKILFVNPLAKEIELRARDLLRKSYFMPEDAPYHATWPIQFEIGYLNSFTSGNKWVSAIARPSPEGASIAF